MVNKITRESAKELGIDFNDLIKDFYDTSYQEYHRNSTFSQQSIVEINEEYYPTVPKELYGYWETNEYDWSDEHGYISNHIDTLTRVELETVTRTITETCWFEVKDKTIKAE